MNSQVYLFAVFVFFAVFALAMGLSIPVFGENRQAGKRLRQRLDKIRLETEASAAVDLIRKDRFKGLQPWEVALENSALLQGLRSNLEQAGHTMKAYQLVLLALLAGLVTAFLCFALSRVWPLALGGFLVGFSVPLLKVNSDKNKRLARIDEQLPEAVDIMRRALQAGHPFKECLHLVAEELDEPINKEFAVTFSDLSYGCDLKLALLGLLERVQSVNVMALVTSILIQRETGGNLAEILSNIGKIIRARFRFSRKVRTLSAEGRMSAWILALVPFVLFVMLYVTTPEYLPVLVESELGRKLVVAAMLAMGLGILWMRKIIRIEV